VLSQSGLQDAALPENTLPLFFFKGARRMEREEERERMFARKGPHNSPSPLR